MKLNIEELMNEHYAQLSQNDLHIWKYIQAHKEECKSLSINALADRCNVSKTTILRFAQKLTLKGYSELKVCLNWENSNPANQYSDGDLVYKICESSKHAIDEIRERDFSDICEMIYHANRIFVYGTGALQNSVANELQRMFLYCGEFLYVLTGEKETGMILPSLKDGDIVILISLSGESTNINEFANQLLVRNIPMISLTKLKNNELARKSQKSIYIATSQVTLGNRVMHEAANLFFVLAEILFLRYAQYKERNDDSNL